jgi:hypothetical protein
MVSMRVAATLAHALPTIRLRIRSGDETLLEVAHPTDAAGGAVGPCSFRHAVACAYEQTKRGLRIGFKGVADGDDPAVDIALRRGDALLPGGIYRIVVGDQTIHGFATTLQPRQCRSLLRPLPDAAHVVHLHHDAATEITFVHTVTPTDTAPADASHLTPALEALIAAEVTREFAASTAP